MMLVGRGGRAGLGTRTAHVMALGAILVFVAEQLRERAQRGGEFPDHCSSVFFPSRHGYQPVHIVGRFVQGYRVKTNAPLRQKLADMTP